MLRQDKARRIGEILDGLYAEPPIPLDHSDPFTLLVAVALSAQTTDKKVNQVTPELFRVAPSPAAMAALPVDRIREIIREVGLAPTKAKHLQQAAALLVERHGGVVPADMDALEALPGVGHKTASVVMAQAFGVPSFPVDTHIHRLAGRWGLSRARNVVETERDLKAVFARETWNRRHLQIIFFGREHCPARGHDLAACPICSFAATKARVAAEAPKTSSRSSERASRRGSGGT
jgi:endonuclease-3